MNFKERILNQELDRLTDIELKAAINQGLQELLALVKNKPADLDKEIDAIEATLQAIRSEIDRRCGPYRV